MRLASVITPFSDENLALAAQTGVTDITIRYQGSQLARSFDGTVAGIGINGVTKERPAHLLVDPLVGVCFSLCLCDLPESVVSFHVLFNESTLCADITRDWHPREHAGGNTDLRLILAGNPLDCLTLTLRAPTCRGLQMCFCRLF